MTLVDSFFTTPKIKNLPHLTFLHAHVNFDFLLADNNALIRRFRSSNSLNTATSIATSINSIPSETNQYDIESVEDDDEFVIVENTRL